MTNVTPMDAPLQAWASDTGRVHYGTGLPPGAWPIHRAVTPAVRAVIGAHTRPGYEVDPDDLHGLWGWQVIPAMHPVGTTDRQIDAFLAWRDGLNTALVERGLPGTVLRDSALEVTHEHA